MANFEVRFRDGTTEQIGEVHAYQQEGTMTTFFALPEGRDVVDCWSTRVASVRTADILMVRRSEERALRVAR